MPVSVNQLARATETTPRQVEQALEQLQADYRGRGFSIEKSQRGYQLTSSAEYSKQVAQLLELESSSRLTKAALEVLAVVAYQQPVTRPYVDSIRGVNSESALRTLVRYGLVEEAGRTDAPGRPILYTTTPDFLQYFGLASLDELPPLQLEPASDPDETRDMEVD
jgi:segregation and condensation protein B